MDHYSFSLRLLDKFNYYVLVHIIITIAYLFLYRKIYWGVFDPLFFSILNMVSSAVCVYFLYNEDYLDAKYKWSFITTEIAFFIGIYTSMHVPKIKIIKENTVDLIFEDRSLFDIFSNLVCGIYIVSEAINIKSLGLALFSNDETINHVNIYEGHGILMAFVTSYRLILGFTIFYKVFLLKNSLNWINILAVSLLTIATLANGSKSAIFGIFFQYFIIVYPAFLRGDAKQIKLSIFNLILFVSFPVMIIMILAGTDFNSAVGLLYLRVLISGDIFLLGYNDNVLASINEKSFIHYAFYPGWGTVLKYMGFNIKPPEIIGVDVFDYYYNVRDNGTNTGANARYNYISLHFFGFYGAIIYSLIIGFIVGYMREIYKIINFKKIKFIYYFIMAIGAFFSHLLIDDIIMFSNYMFWRIFFLLITYTLSLIIYKLLSVSPYYSFDYNLVKKSNL